MADPDYCSAFTKVLDDLLNDSDIPDAHLLYRAQQHLKVLEDPAFRTTNLLPPDHLAPCDPRGAPTYKGIFDAMFRTAEAFDVGWGTRYVSAGICACALYALADCQLRGAVDARSINTELAELLTSLASTWIKDLIAPCEIQCFSPCDLDFCRSQMTRQFLEQTPRIGSHQFWHSICLMP